MPAVYGIIKNHNGWVGVESKAGLGTTVEIYVPFEA
jgi:signal transduction histidine kinase